MQSEGITWSDIGNAIEGPTDGKFTKEEMQEVFATARKEGVDAGIKIGMARVQTQQQSNGHIVLPEPSEMAQYCHERLSRLKNDNERDFVSDAYLITRRGIKLTLPKLGYLASLYIKNGGRTE
jgi:hypothetical protein